MCDLTNTNGMRTVHIIHGVYCSRTESACIQSMLQQQKPYSDIQSPCYRSQCRHDCQYDCPIQHSMAAHGNHYERKSREKYVTSYKLFGQMCVDLVLICPLISCWNYTRHPIPWHCKWALAHLLWLFWKKMTINTQYNEHENNYACQ